jgi:hypothetical protein
MSKLIDTKKKLIILIAIIAALVVGILLFTIGPLAKQAGSAGGPAVSAENDQVSAAGLVVEDSATVDVDIQE